MYDLDMNFVGEYECCRWLERHSEELFGKKLTQGCINRVCRGERKTYKGYIFKFKETC